MGFVPPLRWYPSLLSGGDKGVLQVPLAGPANQRLCCPLGSQAAPGQNANGIGQGLSFLQIMGGEYHRDLALQLLDYLPQLPPG